MKNSLERFFRFLSPVGASCTAVLFVVLALFSGGMVEGLLTLAAGLYAVMIAYGVPHHVAERLAGSDK